MQPVSSINLEVSSTFTLESPNSHTGYVQKKSQLNQAILFILNYCSINRFSCFNLTHQKIKAKLLWG